MYKNEKDRRLTESFVKYGTVILKHCRDYLKDKHEAEDVLQETFYKFGENYEKVPEEKTRTWLLVTASHQCLDLMKKSGRKRTVVGLPVPDVEDLIDPIDLSDLFVSRENMAEHLLVLEQLREMNPTWYQVIVFSTVYDLDNNTIGELLGQKPELISKWKSRGRAWLRKRYKEQYPNG